MFLLKPYIGSLIHAKGIAAFLCFMQEGEGLLQLIIRFLVFTQQFLMLVLGKDWTPLSKTAYGLPMYRL